MPDVTIDAQVQGNITRLTDAVKTDTLTRARFLADPVSVLKEYGLGNLIPSTRQFALDLRRTTTQLGEGQARPVPFGLFHVDTGFGHTDHADGHDDTHSDGNIHNDSPAVHLDFL
jgi:hypothetical protein